MIYCRYTDLSRVIYTDLSGVMFSVKWPAFVDTELTSVPIFGWSYDQMLVLSDLFEERQVGKDRRLM